MIPIRGILQSVYRLAAVRGQVAVGKDFHLGVGTRVWSSSGLTIGDHVYIGKWCTVEVDGYIGNGVLIGNSVGIVGRDDHDVRSVGVLARLAPWIGDPDFERTGKRLEVRVEDDVWIGYGAIVLSGVTIGRGAIVAVGSVVTCDVNPYDIVGGNPARKLGRRFNEREIAEHELLLRMGPVTRRPGMTRGER